MIEIDHQFLHIYYSIDHLILVNLNSNRQKTVTNRTEKKNRYPISFKFETDIKPLQIERVKEKSLS